MTRRSRPREPLARDRRLAHLVLTAIAIAAALDGLTRAGGHGPSIPIVGAEFFVWLWQGLQFIGSALGAAAEATAAYLATVISWLAKRVADFLFSSGAIFAKVWEGIRIVWSDVLKPALTWVGDWLKRIHKWLVDTFGPVLKFLKDVRDRLLSFYRDFVRPVLDTIDFIRAINRVLLAFHVTVLQSLDRVLTELERKIDEGFGFVLRQLTRVQNVIDRIVTFDGLFTRLALIRSLATYAPDWLRIWWNSQTVQLTDADRQRIYGRDPPLTLRANVDAFNSYAGDRGGPLRATVAELVAQFDLDVAAARGQSASRL